MSSTSSPAVSSSSPGDANDGVSQSRSGMLTSVLSLFASSSTLICCALPALLVALGAGAALSGLVGAFPQIVWLSEHKISLFITAGVLLAASGWLQWRNRSAPCPIDPALRDACLKTRKLSWRVYWVSVGIYAVGGWFAFVMPLLM
jgi:hypothetical protein